MSAYWTHSLKLQPTRQVCSRTIPKSYPRCVSLRSALSALRDKRYSARDVNILYGSDVPRVTKSSMSTPIRASSRPSTSSCSGDPALQPASMPCAAASS
eukprot:scaffold603_cov404-Prasinococcus_capsulatus_cf.AAC.36